jgi:O-antigen ligase
MSARALAARGGDGPFAGVGPVAILAGTAALAAACALPAIYFVAGHPRAIPALAIATPLVALVILRPRWVVPIFFAYIWSALPPDVLGGIPSPADLGATTLLAVSAWLAFREWRLAAQVGAVFALLSLSLLAAGLVAVGGPEIFADGLKDLAFLVIAAFCVRGIADAERVVIALAAVGIVLGLGSAYSILAHPIGPFTVALPVGPLDPSAPRAAGLLYGDPNFFALSLATLVPFAMYLAGRGGGRTWLGAAALGALFAGILATGSRGGLLAAGVAGLAWAVAGGSPRMRRVALIGAVSIAAVTPLFGAQLTSAGDRDITARLNENRIALAMWADHPVTGIGPNQYGGLFRDYARKYGSDPRTDRAAHSLPLQIISEQGLFGVVAWCVAGLLVFRYARARDVWALPVGRAVIVALVTYLAGSLFLHGSQLRLPFILAGLIFALGARRAPPTREAG